MPTIVDLLYIALFALALPLWDYLVAWPALERQFQTDAARARRRLWVSALVYPWGLVALGAALWISNHRSWAALGFAVPIGWRLLLGLLLLVLLVLYYAQACGAVARDPEARAGVQRQFTGELAKVLPRTRAELTWFSGVSLTAGFCEEFLYRGYFIWAVSPWLGWWGAAAVSVVFFAGGHLYQGWPGVLRTGLVGGIFTGLVALFDSLWPAIVLHALVDLGSGCLAWLALREESEAAA